MNCKVFLACAKLCIWDDAFCDYGAPRNLLSHCMFKKWQEKFLETFIILLYNYIPRIVDRPCIMTSFKA